MAVLELLQEQATALPELLQLLGPSDAERTVRRWLNDMITQGHIKKVWPQTQHTISSSFKSTDN